MRWHWMIVCGVGLLAAPAWGQSGGQAGSGRDASTANPRQQQRMNQRQGENAQQQPGRMQSGDQAAGAMDDQADSQAGSQAGSDGGLSTQTEKVSYGIGLDLGTNLSRNFEQNEIEVNADLIAEGLKDAFSGAEPRISRESLRQAMMKFQQEMRAKMQQQQGQGAQGQAGGPGGDAEQMQQGAAENKEMGRQFLEQNKQKQGVQVTDSGLQYKVLEEGDGPSPSATDTVRVHYEGRLIDGTVFDSSLERGEPATFPVNRVIPGWTEALKMMSVGGKWRLFIPAKLAYGQRGAGQNIGPNETLIFDVELLGVEGQGQRNQGRTNQPREQGQRQQQN